MENPQFTELKKKMAAATTVEEWNALREEAKTEYDQSIINQLDYSGYITKVLSTKPSENGL